MNIYVPINFLFQRIILIKNNKNHLIYIAEKELYGYEVEKGICCCRFLFSFQNKKGDEKIEKIPKEIHRKKVVHKFTHIVSHKGKFICNFFHAFI
jgi:hypothetical protein